MVDVVVVIIKKNKSVNNSELLVNRWGDDRKERYFLPAWVII